MSDLNPNIAIEQGMVIYPELRRIRRKLHSFPETGFDLKRTVALIGSWLESIGIPFQTGIGRSGIVALIQGDRPGPVVGLRADMDALPIQEINDVGYTSRIKGIMHACGHDLHIACLMGAAKLLAGYKEKMPGAIKLIFQPAEEIDFGAKAMIFGGVLENPKVDILFGLHNYPGLPTGYIALRPGPLMAGIDTFQILVKGRGGHGAIPDKTVDALLVAASIVLQIQTIVSRNVSPMKEAVVTIGTFHAGVSENIIADQAEMKGTARTLDPEIRQQFPGIIRRIVENGCKAFGANGKVEYQNVLPVLSNDIQATELVRQSASRLLGEKAVQTAEITMGGDDFSLMLEKVPGCYFWLGATPPGTSVRGWHSANFDIDDKAIPLGSMILAQAALDYLFTRDQQAING